MKGTVSVPKPDRNRITKKIVLLGANPVALARINAGITQEGLARLMQVTQAYISKVENQDKITPKMPAKVKAALAK